MVNGAEHSVKQWREEGYTQLGSFSAVSLVPIKACFYVSCNELKGVPASSKVFIFIKGRDMKGLQLRSVHRFKWDQSKEENTL